MTPNLIEAMARAIDEGYFCGGEQMPAFMIAQSVLTAISEAGCTIVSKDDLHELLRTANEAREALDMGTRYEKGAGGMSIDAQVARTFIGNVPARIVEPLYMALAAFDAANQPQSQGGATS